MPMLTMGVQGMMAEDDCPPPVRDFYNALTGCVQEFGGIEAGIPGKGYVGLQFRGFDLGFLPSADNM